MQASAGRQRQALLERWLASKTDPTALVLGGVQLRPCSRRVLCEARVAAGAVRGEYPDEVREELQRPRKRL